MGRSEGRCSVRAQRNLQTPEASPPEVPGIPDGSGTCTFVNKHLSVSEYVPQPGLWGWTPCRREASAGTTPGLGLIPQMGGHLPRRTLGGAKVLECCCLAGRKPGTFGCTLACPFPCALLPCPRSGFSPEPSLAHNALKLQPPGSQSKNRCHGERRVARPRRT